MIVYHAIVYHAIVFWWQVTFQEFHLTINRCSILNVRICNYLKWDACQTLVQFWMTLHHLFVINQISLKFVARHVKCLFIFSNLVRAFYYRGSGRVDLCGLNDRGQPLKLYFVCHFNTFSLTWLVAAWILVFN